MPERADRSEETRQDLSKLMEQSVSTLQEVDRRLQDVRTDLATLMARAASLQGGPEQAYPGGVRGFVGYGSLPPPGAVQGYPAPPLAPMPFGGPAFQGSPMHPMVLGPLGTPTMLPRGGGAGLGEGMAAPTPPAPEQRGPGQAQREGMPPMLRLPSVDLVDQGEAFVVQFELPGVKKEDLDLVVSDRLVTVQATTRPGVEGGVLLLQERPPTTYRRSLPLPAEVNTTKSKATFKDGILTLTVPKKAPGEGPRKLDVAYG